MSHYYVMHSYVDCLSLCYCKSIWINHPTAFTTIMCCLLMFASIIVLSMSSAAVIRECRLLTAPGALGALGACSHWSRAMSMSVKRSYVEIPMCHFVGCHSNTQVAASHFHWLFQHWHSHWKAPRQIFPPLRNPPKAASLVAGRGHPPDPVDSGGF